MTPPEISDWINPFQEVYFITVCAKPRGINQLIF